MFLKSLLGDSLCGENRYIVDTTQNRPGLKQRSLHAGLCFLGGDFESSSPADCEGVASLVSQMGWVREYMTSQEHAASKQPWRWDGFPSSIPLLLASLCSTLRNPAGSELWGCALLRQGKITAKGKR